MKALIILGAVVGLVLAPSAAMANWSDNFDGYGLGSLNGVGGWQGWGGVGSVAGTVVNDHFLSAPNSQKIGGATSDSVHQYTGYTSGHWTYAAMQFIPTDFTGNTFFIMVNKYADPAGPFNWSVQMGFNSSTGQIDADVGSSSQQHMPYVTNQWVPIRAEIYLDQDWVQVYYNNTLIDDPALADHPTLGGGYQWTRGVFGNDTNGLVNIAAVDLYNAYDYPPPPSPPPNPGSPVYYDNMSLTPEPASLVLLGFGLLLVTRRR